MGQQELLRSEREEEEEESNSHLSDDAHERYMACARASSANKKPDISNESIDPASLSGCL